MLNSHAIVIAERASWPGMGRKFSTSAHKFRLFSTSRRISWVRSSTYKMMGRPRNGRFFSHNLSLLVACAYTSSRRASIDVRVFTMFADQVGNVATFAREHPFHALGYLVLFNILLYILFTEIERYNARLAGFKGPSGYPIIGNIWQIRTNAAEQYRQWARKFGAVYQIQLGNIPIVVVNSAAAARTIFGQNAQALSSRPEFYTFHKVCSPRLPLNTLAYVSRLSQALLGPQSARRLSASH